MSVPKVKRPGSPILFAITMAVVIFIGQRTDYVSCKRQEPVRQFFINDRVLTRESIAYWNAHGQPAVAIRAGKRLRFENSIRKENCGKLLPDSK